MTDALVITRVREISVPNNQGRSVQKADTTFEVSFDFNLQCEGVITYFESLNDIKAFFDEIAAYASYKIKRNIKTNGGFKK